MLPTQYTKEVQVRGWICKGEENIKGERKKAMVTG